MNQGLLVPTATKGYDQGLGVGPSPSPLGQHLQVQQLACSPPAQTALCLSPRIRASSRRADGAEEDAEKVYHENLCQVPSEEAQAYAQEARLLSFETSAKTRTTFR